MELSRLGLGCGAIGDAGLDERAVERLVHGALDLGIMLFDTARSYGLSEERIGRALAGRRGSFVLSTKVGYDMAPHPDWTGACVAAGVEAARGRLRCEVIDIVHLHSCSRELLERGEVVGALEDAVRAGAVRLAGYSGDGEAAAFAVESGRFAALETSVNVVDQAALAGVAPAAAERGMVVIAKRPLANGAWRWAPPGTAPPGAPDAAEYTRRFRVRDLDEIRDGLEWAELAIRFAAFASGVTCAVVGTSSLAHLEAAAAAVARGPLPEPQVEALRAAFPPGWPGVV